MLIRFLIFLERWTRIRHGVSHEQIYRKFSTAIAYWPFEVLQ